MGVERSSTSSIAYYTGVLGSPEGDLADRIEHEARSKGVEIFLEFDEFCFPEHCVGMTIGGGGRQSLELRSIFGIGLTFIGRYTADGQLEPIDIKPNTTIKSGDCGLVCRVPERETGFSKSIISDDLLRPLMDSTLFEKKRSHLK